MPHYRRQHRQKTALEHVLLGLIPYTRENFALTFKPHVFFNELEQTSGWKRNTLRAAYYHAQRSGYVRRIDNRPQLTRDGERAVLPFYATKLGNDAQLLIMFDIPLEHAKQRQQLRRMLKRFGFTLVQQSVWMSNMDYRQALMELVSELGLEQFVEIHESVKLYPSS